MDVMEALSVADMKQALDAAPDAKSRPTGKMAALITEIEFEDAAEAKKKDDESDG